ncbi:MAG: V-type ATP synthase subunit F [bacterium]
MSNIAFISKPYTTQAFAALGARIATCNTSKEAENALDNLIKEKYLLIFITEDLAIGLMDQIELINNKNHMYISVLPDETGKSSLVYKKIAAMAQNAVGTQIVGRE